MSILCILILVDRPVIVEKHVPVATPVVAAPAYHHSAYAAHAYAAPAYGARAYGARAYAAPAYSYGPTHVPHVEHYHH